MDIGRTKPDRKRDMEVEELTKKTALMRDYMAMFQRQSYIFVISAAVMCAVAITTLLIVFQIMPLFSWQSIVTFIIMALLLSATAAGLFWQLNKPFAELVNAVIMMTGTPSDHTPPNPNARSESEDGFKHLLQSLYELRAQDTPVVAEEASGDEELRLALDQTSSGVIILDNEQNIVYNNKNAPVRINRDGEKFITVRFPETDTLSHWIELSQENTVHNERIWTRVADRPPGEQNRRIFDVAASFTKDNVAETVLTLFDRTDTYAPEEDDLDFISFAAHELRGPITVIRGYLDVIDEELGPQLHNDQKELMQRLIVSANRLSSYINNILNASRYDRRHFKIHLGEENIRSIYDTINDDMQLRASSQHRLLTIDIPKSLPTVAADKNSIGEVMSNLIDNAIKYSNEGGTVTVKARAISGFIEVSIVDRGIGMPASVIPNLFHKFYRSHRSRETVAGTGIGLYLSKAIVESHGGSIEVRSTESEGSTFSFTLPIYSTVAEKIKAGNNSNELLIVHGGGWIRNHSLYRG